MNEKKGDDQAPGAERPQTSLDEWQAQVRLFRGLTQRLTLCYGCGDPSIVDLQDAAETLRILTAVNINLLGEAARRSQEVGAQ